MCGCCNTFTPHRFAPSDIIFLHDDAPRQRQPTSTNVRGAVHWLLKGAAPGASLLLVFAGPALIPSDGWPSADINTGSVQGFCFADERSSLTLELRTLLQSTSMPPDCRLHAVIDTVSGVVPIDLPAAAQLRANGLPVWQVHFVCVAYVHLQHTGFFPVSLLLSTYFTTGRGRGGHGRR